MGYSEFSSTFGAIFDPTPPAQHRIFEPKKQFFCKCETKKPSKNISFDFSEKYSQTPSFSAPDR